LNSSHKNYGSQCSVWIATLREVYATPAAKRQFSDFP
jgi:hypothetical protein